MATEQTSISTTRPSDSNTSGLIGSCVTADDVARWLEEVTLDLENIGYSETEVAGVQDFIISTANPISE